MTLHLIQPRELFGPPAREQELMTAWARNVGVFDVYTHPPGRPTFAELFAMCLSGAVNVIANSDIYFMDLRAELWAWDTGGALALSRWDVKEDGSITLWDHGDSQDAWIIRDGPHQIDAPFTMGVPGCDNALAHRLVMAGFRVTNPSKTVRAYHLHNFRHRSYLADPTGTARGGDKTERVPPPYHFVKPTEL